MMPLGLDGHFKQYVGPLIAAQALLWAYSFTVDPRTRQVVLGLVGLWWCFAALWVEVRLEHVYPHFDYKKHYDMSEYTPFCDFSPWAKCSNVLMSPPGRMLRYFGVAKQGGGDSLLDKLRGLIDVPNPTLGVMFFGCHLFYPALLMIPVVNDLPIAWLFFAACCFVGVMTVWLAYNLFFVLRDFCVVCVSMYVANYLVIPIMYTLASAPISPTPSEFFGEIPLSLLVPFLVLDAGMGLAVLRLWLSGPDMPAGYTALPSFPYLVPEEEGEPNFMAHRLAGAAVAIVVAALVACGAPFPPLRAAQVCFSGLLAVSLARTIAPLTKFYRWFHSSGLDIARHRGYGQTASPMWGIVDAPSLSPDQMALCGGALLLMSIASCAPGLPGPVIAALLLLQLGAYHLYFSQLYCEAYVGAHVTVLLPPTLILFALSPAFLPDAGEGAMASADFTCKLLQTCILTAYCSAGFCKLVRQADGSAAYLKPWLWGKWCNGATLQGNIFEALYLSNPETKRTFGLPTPMAGRLQRFFFVRPRLLALMSVYSVALELFAPLALAFPNGPRIFAVLGLGFHYGIAVLQNVDFLSWWSPAYACFVFRFSDASFYEAAATAFEVAPWRAALAMAYVVAHIGAHIVARLTTTELLPFSAFAMFSDVKNIFNAGTRKWIWLTTKPHAVGTLKNYCFPFARRPHVDVKELDLMPFKYLCFGFGGADEDIVHTNVEISKELRFALDKIRAAGCQQEDTYLRDPVAAEGMLTELEDAKALFAKTSRRRMLPPAVPQAKPTVFSGDVAAAA
jgi:vitamin-K-epoxide reductase (warfarin-sensitive)